MKFKDVIFFTNKGRKLSGEINKGEGKMTAKILKDETIYIDARSPKRPDDLYIGATLQIDGIKFAVDNDSEVVVHKETNLAFVSKPSMLFIGKVSPFDMYFEILTLNPQVTYQIEKLPERTEYVEHMGVFGKEKYPLYITPVIVTFKVNEFYKSVVHGRITKLEK